MKKIITILFITLSLLSTSHACSYIKDKLPKPQTEQERQEQQQMQQEQEQRSEPIPVNPSHS
ncbi:MAG: hypothetical protein A3B68_04805 [Candidatus Melainabacteria bacterium RIFCSPHIGHO2_02_FULL_34_12]|nr:MAG: hypothetical protein A3B68_04805 [Candidatus Melainabacteria bacterium RIFCSPHIGHO2_02_FULL_34_12]